MFERVEMYFGGVPKEPQAFHDALVLGELHSHAIKFLFSLIKNNVLVLSDKDYFELVRCYLSPHHNISSVMQQFCEILASATIKHKPCVYIMGSELASHGQNDWFMLMILKKLKDNDVPYKILFSKETVKFLYQFYCWKHKTTPDFKIFELDEQNSFAKLIKLSNQKISFGNILVDKKWVMDMVAQCYLPHLELLDFTYDSLEDKVSIYQTTLRDTYDLNALLFVLGFQQACKTTQASLTELQKCQKMFKTELLPNLCELFDSLAQSQIKPSKQLKLPLQLVQLTFGDYSGLEKYHLQLLKFTNYTLVTLQNNSSHKNVIDLSGTFGKNILDSYGLLKEYGLTQKHLNLFNHNGSINYNFIKHVCQKSAPYLSFLIMVYLFNKHKALMPKSLLSIMNYLGRMLFSSKLEHHLPYSPY